MWMESSRHHLGHLAISENLKRLSCFCPACLAVYQSVHVVCLAASVFPLLLIRLIYYKIKLRVGSSSGFIHNK